MNSYKQQINMHICSKTFTKQENNQQMKCICTTKEKKCHSIYFAQTVVCIHSSTLDFYEDMNKSTFILQGKKTKPYIYLSY